MSCPTSSWSENTKPDLINFLKLANQNKTNKYCNIEEYNRLKKFFPLDEEIKKTLSTTEPIDYIDITNSDEENICSNVIVPPINEIKDCSTNETTSNFKELIMDYLRVEENIPETLFEEILKLSHETREELFQSLVKEISLEELGTFWNSFNIRRNIRECIIKNFINTLFLPMIKQKHTYVMGIIFKELSEYNKTDLKSTLIQEFTKEKDVKIIHILLQYVGELRCDFRSALLSDFVCHQESLEETHIIIIENLLNPTIKNNVLVRLIELMALYSTEFSNEKTFGKLLFKIVSSIDRNSPGLEQPLKHILGTHRSIWKIKIEQHIFNWFNDTLTQSFM